MLDQDSIGVESLKEKGHLSNDGENKHVSPLLPKRASAELFSAREHKVFLQHRQPFPHWVVSPWYSQRGQHAEEILRSVRTRTADVDAN